MEEWIACISYFYRKIIIRLWFLNIAKQPPLSGGGLFRKRNGGFWFYLPKSGAATRQAGTPTSPANIRAGPRLPRPPEQLLSPPCLPLADPEIGKIRSACQLKKPQTEKLFLIVHRFKYFPTIYTFVNSQIWLRLSTGSTNSQVQH